ncbi:type I-E CRISPR-associated protein Cse2/CasB [Bifidobacterium gallicum]|uniref:type I-E CRISPR-associated protein Cse2/CasB n=1 Tax=Bifidobacterium gallicum TaxID=78342 RepID=UPI0013635B5B|nr:type I-E CRISPR-associated protein Cse2/CasB [Bifidobacterium gallicum]
MNRLVRNMQQEYVGNGGASADVRAVLANLRKCADPAHTDWLAAGAVIFDAWPEDMLGDPEHDSRLVKAITTALGLYAVHQQSKDYGVAQLRKEEGEYYPISFGKACQFIAEGSDEDKGVVRRLNAAENAPTFEGTAWYLRALIMLMRSTEHPIALDYGRLARDLYLMQFPDSRGAVFQRWSMDYHYRQSQRNAESSNK